jgi:hypothetical protein
MTTAFKDSTNKRKKEPLIRQMAIQGFKLGETDSTHAASVRSCA